MLESRFGSGFLGPRELSQRPDHATASRVAIGNGLILKPAVPKGEPSLPDGNAGGLPAKSRRGMKAASLITLTLLCALSSPGYTDGTVLVLSTGATSLTVGNSGPLGGSQVVNLPVGATQKAKIWFSIPGAFPQRGAEQPCAAPCFVSLNTEYGQTGYWYEITDSSGAPLNPPQVSSEYFLAFTPSVPKTAPFTVPTPIHGFKNYTARYQFTIPGGTDVSNLRVWLWAQNLREGSAAVLGNTGVEHVLATTPIVGFIANGSACTATTSSPHGLSAGQVIQQNFFNNIIPGLSGPGPLNALFTIASTPTPTTYTIPCSLTPGDYNTGFGAVGQNIGKTVSATTFYADETKWWGGIDDNHQAHQIMVPMGATEFTAGASNTLALRFKGVDAAFIQTYGLVHGWWALDWNIVQPDVAISQIVVSGATATAMVSAVPAAWKVGDTILIRDAPGPRWRFNGKRVLTAVTSNTFTFAWGSDLPGETPGVAPYTTTNGTYTVPTSNDVTMAPQPIIYAARCLIPYSSYQYYDPTSFPSYGGNAAAGFTTFTTGTLKDPGPYAPNNVSNATCSGCHMHGTGSASSSMAPGWDLKFFNYPPSVIKVASMARGKTETEANDIVAYIASIPIPIYAKARPWNPPYQPAPNLDSLSVDDWRAGGGLEWVLNYDADVPEWLIPGGSFAGWAYNASLNMRQLPTVLQMPFWSRWLPETHPSDFFANSLGSSFASDALWAKYQGYLSSLVPPQPLASGISSGATSMSTSAALACTNNDEHKIDQEYVQVTAGCGTTSQTIVRARRGSTAAAHLAGAYMSDFTAYANSGGSATFMQDFTTAIILYDQAHEISTLPGFPGSGGYENPSMYARDYYSVIKWWTSRQFDLLNSYRLQDMLDQVVNSFYTVTPHARAASQFTRGWMSAGPFHNGPHATVGGAPYFLNTGGTNTSRNFDLESAIWYYLASILDIDDRLNQSGGSIDWRYYFAFAKQLSSYRAMLYTALLWEIIQVQNTMGWTDLNGNVGGAYDMILTSWMFGYTFGFRYSNLLSTETEIGNAVSAITANLAAVIPLFSTAQWQSFALASNGRCPLNTVPVPVDAANGQGRCCGDEIAFMLPIATHYRADVSAIVTWANALWATSGHNFQADANATCAYDNNEPPRFLRCTNW
jgi:hypothetical protein